MTVVKRLEPWRQMIQLPEVPQHLKDIIRTDADRIDEVWRNDIYEVFVRYLGADRLASLQLSIKRHDREPVTDWRHKQSIKNEVAGDLREALELYPAETRLVDAANQTHLWVAYAGVMLEVGFETGMTGTKEVMREAAIKLGYDPAQLDKAKQRPWQPGLSTGPEYSSQNTHYRDGAR